MGDFLDQVVKEKEIELVQKRASVSLQDLEKKITDHPVRGFAAALGASGTRIIAEIKRRSPSVTKFRQQKPVEEMARIYEQNGASAISVVTDTPNFGMSLADVACIRSAVALPVLVKEFVIDRYQALEARAAGADALLLIVRILSTEKLAELHAAVQDLGMTALVECHDESDLQKAVQIGARVVGINNRNLGDLSISLENTRRLLSVLPKDVIRVSESGIERREQIEELSQQGIDAFLIGGALLNALDPGATLASMCGKVSGSR